MNVTAKIFLAAMVVGTLGNARAELTWEKKEIELHPKPTDPTAVANFQYENKGTKPVKITSVKSSCGCTVASSKKDDVAPGEKGEITATFNIGGRTGTQEKAVTVTTDDPAQPLINLMLKVVVPVALEVQPTFVYWQNGEATTAKVIRVKAAKEFAITKLDVTSSDPQFTTKVEKGSAPGEFTITVQPKETSQLSNATLTIKPDSGQTFYATARIVGQVPTAGR